MSATERDRSEACPSGVYLIDEALRARIPAGAPFPPDITVAVVDGEAAGSRAAFFTEIARVLNFPDYFGRNWDAVYDCLTDPGWFPTAGLALILDGFATFAVAEPEQWQIALKVFQDACAFWRPLPRPFYVLLYGPAEKAPGIGSLPAGCLHSSP